ncbi:glycosyl hydrolase family 15 [Alcanivorax sp. NBRC 101098]|nr:glycosyl hydrolase family 15 [Alcanivorax sp. NBRC 101098]
MATNNWYFKGEFSMDTVSGAEEWAASDKPIANSMLLPKRTSSATALG